MFDFKNRLTLPEGWTATGITASMRPYRAVVTFRWDRSTPLGVPGIERLIIYRTDMSLCNIITFKISLNLSNCKPVDPLVYIMIAMSSGVGEEVPKEYKKFLK